nr:alpha/beta hydrolase family protein [uncultured Sellimonas sp.]
MALLHVDFFSEILEKSMNMDVILPQNTTNQIGMKGNAGSGKYKTVYLLHGMSDDQTTWQRRTSIERYVSEYGIAVVMPNADLGFYTNTAYGLPYWTFFSEELPKICREFFPQMSEKREDTLAAGLSMGGYGAWKLGLGVPETFGAAASLSGVLDVARRVREEYAKAGRKPAGFWEGIFGDLDKIEGSENDLKYLAGRLKEENRPVPRLYAWCGTEDFLYQNNLDMWEEMKRLGYSVVTASSEGDHQWKYWDQQIQAVLEWWLK